MLKIYCGDNIVKSRDAFVGQIEAYKQKGIKDIVAFDGKKITLLNLQESTQSPSFFEDGRLITIENLFSRPQSKLKTDILNYLANIESDTDIIVWEKKALTPAQSRKFSKATIQDFKVDKLLFKFLDALQPNRSSDNYTFLKKVVASESYELVFAMLIRQVRLLLQVKSNAQVKLAPWQKQRLLKQAGFFEEKELLKIHAKLLEMDIHQKTGQGLLTLDQSIDRLMLSL